VTERDLERFARRVRDDRYFLASALEDYARSEDLDGAGLAGALGCRRSELGALGLCRRPRTDPVGFRSDVVRIAERFGLSEVRLAEIVRRSDALIALREAEEDDVIAAARDRPAEDDASDEEPM
jgi:hypothetical protein